MRTINSLGSIQTSLKLTIGFFESKCYRQESGFEGGTPALRSGMLPRMIKGCNLLLI